MHHLRITPQARSEVILVLYGDAPSWRERSRKYDDLVNQALVDIKTNPTSGDRRRIAGVEVFTLHIGRRGKRAVHQFLYRVVGDLVEVGRFLHQADGLEDKLPAEWLVRAVAA